MPILDEIKKIIDIDVNDFDDELILIINSALSYLQNNNIPVSQIDKQTEWSDFDKLDTKDTSIVLSYLHLKVIQLFDRTSIVGSSSQAFNQWIDETTTDLIHQLKCIYEYEVE